MEQITLSDGTCVQVSADDFQWAISLKWNRSATTNGKAGYAARSGTVDGRRWLTYMHREIAVRAGILTDHGDSRCVDHLNRDHFDNRRENLRAVDFAENNGNVAPRTSSGMLGVYRSRGGWSAEVQRHGRRRRRSGFTTPEEARDWRSAALAELREKV